MRSLLHRSHWARTSLSSRLLYQQQHVFSTAPRQTARSTKRPWTPKVHHLSKVASLRLQSLDEAASQRPSGSHHRDTVRKVSDHLETVKTYLTFRKLALSCFEEQMKKLDSWDQKKPEYNAFGVTSQLDFDREVLLFRQSLSKACDLANQGRVERESNPLFWTLRNAFITLDLRGLYAELRYAFQSFLTRSMFPGNIQATHRKIADLRFPHEWFPATRALQRTIHLHVGPTNSGKTYNALKALENARSGIYAGPLRLLAHEVYSRFTAKGVSCALITGEEQRIPKDVDVYFKSCTVEMTPLNHAVDVAVIDEIQMIGDAERGWAWTQAVLGVQAKEVHLCGEERAVELIRSLCATIGDECVVHRYERLSGLETMDRSLGGRLDQLEKGDAVVSFSRVGIHDLKRRIEKYTGKRCAVVYGSLPPETRAHQAALFNDPNNDYDYLAASDAIGMGLNLEIKRVVFEATHKRDHSSFRQMTVSELKQIGGRAGRYRTANQAIESGTSNDESPTPEPRGPGLVTCLENEDLAIITNAFRSEAEPITTAGIQPPTAVIERLSTYFPPNTPFSFILNRLRDTAQISSRYHMCHFKDMVTIADLIQPFPMSIYDRCVFLNAPAAVRDPNGARVLQTFAKCVSRMEGGNLLDMPEVELELLDIQPGEWPGKASEYLQSLEALHKSVTLYLWLSYRFTGVFTSQNLAFHVKGLAEEKINEYLSNISLTDAGRKARSVAMRKGAEARKLKKDMLLGETPQQKDPIREGVGEWNEEGHEEPLYDDASQLKDISPLP
ncbi:P-loop containing nucleoside triphosphate hydrolase protein [Nemania sp. NC0429]|nr:P-loop containing nucleoside triphosphate hydrolase protein [Nemania sp. NC0429]